MTSAADSFDAKARTWDADPAKRERACAVAGAIVAAVPGLFRALVAPGGVLCVSDLDAEDGAFHGAGFTGHDGFDRGDLAARMERAGFRDVRFSTVAEIEKKTQTGVRKFPLFLAIATRP